MSTAVGGECDIASLLDMLKRVLDPRESRSRMYPLSFILAVALVATLAGASNFRQIRDHAADMPPSLLRKVGWDVVLFPMYNRVSE